MNGIYYKMTNIEDAKLQCSKCNKEILSKSNYYDYVGKVVCSVDCTAGK